MGVPVLQAIELEKSAIASSIPPVLQPQEADCRNADCQNMDSLAELATQPLESEEIYPNFWHQKGWTCFQSSYYSKA